VKPVTRYTLFWIPRGLAILFAGFIGMFALDAFSEGHGFWSTMLAFAIHLVPMLILVCVIVVSWRREWIGAVVYSALAVAYWLNFSARPIWILSISGPLLLLAVLYLLGWYYRNAIRMLNV
jgi:hypothetical protein